jgi:hypothetical protein
MFKIKGELFRMNIVPLDLLIDLLWWGENMSQNCGHQRVYFLSPGWYVSVEGHGDDDDGCE